MHKVTLLDFSLDWFFLWELGYPARIESGSSTLRGDLGARFSLVECVAPLRLRGLRGKKSTPSIGWEVPAEVSKVSKQKPDRVQA
jgi:hypothetical protein